MDPKELYMRRRIYFVFPNDIVAFLNLWSEFGKVEAMRVPKLQGIPDDAFVAEMYFDNQRFGVGFVVVSPSFDIVEVGQIPPIVPTEFEILTLVHKEK